MTKFRFKIGAPHTVDEVRAAICILLGQGTDGQHLTWNNRKVYINQKSAVFKVSVSVIDAPEVAEVLSRMKCIRH